MSVDIFRNYKPLKAHVDFHQSDEHTRLMVGGYGSGKSYACAQELKRIVCAKHDNTVLVGRKTYGSLIKTTLVTLKEVFDEDVFIDLNENKRRIRVKTLDGGVANVLYGDMDDVQKIRSLEVSSIWLNELSEFDEEMYLALFGRMRLPYERRMICDTNPTSKSHWIYRRFVEPEMGQSKDGPVYYSTAFDNPFVTRDYVAKMAERYNKEQQEVYIFGKWGAVQTGKPVYPQLRRGLHICDAKPSEGLPMWRFWDLGSNNPRCIWAQMSRRGHLVLFDGLYGAAGTTTSLPAFIGMVKSHHKQKGFPSSEIYDVADISSRQRSDTDGRTRVEVFWENGIRPITNTVPMHDGLMLVQKRMETLDGGHPKFLVARKCDARVYDDLSAYEWGDHIAEGYDDPFPKKNGPDHTCDAIRYGVWHLDKCGGINSGDGDADLIAYTRKNADNARKALG